MVSIVTFRKLALSLPETSEEAHFEKTSFRINKKIFATYDAKLHKACLKLSDIDQDVFSAFDRSVIYPVNNKWGKQGWTFIEMKKIRKDMFVDALTCAYLHVAPKKISERIKTILPK